MAKTAERGNGPSAAGRRSLTHRVFRILDAFAEAESGLTPAEVVRRTGLPKSTVHRIVNDLLRLGTLQNVNGELCLGMHLFELGSLVPANRRLREAALPFMEDLYEATHQVVHLGILDGPDVLYLLKISGHDRLPLPTRDGGRMPAHATGLGKALLASSGQAVVQRFLRAPLEAMTPHTIIHADALLKELAEVARTGVAFDYEEAVEGVVCTAAPISVPGRPSRAAVSVTGAANRFDPAQAANAVRQAGYAISKRLAGGTSAETGPRAAPGSGTSTVV